MSHAMLRLAADLLDAAADVFSNHGCNDYKMDRFSEAERREIADLMNRCNFDCRDIATVNPDDITTAEQIEHYANDAFLMNAAAYGLRKEADRAESMRVAMSAPVCGPEDEAT